MDRTKVPYCFIVIRFVFNQANCGAVETQLQEENLIFLMGYLVEQVDNFLQLANLQAKLELISFRFYRVI